MPPFCCKKVSFLNNSFWLKTPGYESVNVELVTKKANIIRISFPIVIVD